MQERVVANSSGVWEIPDNLDITNFDLNWRPFKFDRPYIHQFGTQHQKTGGPRYVVPGATQVKYVDSPRAIKLTDQTNRCWRGSENIQFDFTWHPDETEPPFIYQFGDQWYHDNGPRYVVPGATQVKYMDYPKAVKLPDQSNRCWRGAENIQFDWSWYPDKNEPPFIYQFGTQWQKTGGPRYVVPGATQVKYMDYPKAVKLPDQSNRCWRGAENIVDNFDWSWHPDDTEPPFIYQFGTQWQKTGGPRYVVPGATQVKYMDCPRATKLSNTEGWTVLHADSLQETFDWSWHPDASEAPHQYVFGTQYYPPEVCPAVTWGSGSPKYMAAPTIKCKSPQLFFMSNGEIGEQERYERLCNVANRDVTWVRGIDGRENAIRRCAELSDTEWALIVPAKLWANENFSWDWQPNRSIKQHYIFYASNPLNNLIYGHQAPVAYHCATALNTINYGLDYTMSAAHDVVAMIAGVAQYNCDSLITWRTAFREVIKLRAAADQGDVESAERLHVWLTVANGEFAQYSIAGAQHAIEFYEQVDGSLDDLQATFSWDWMNKRYQQMYTK